MGNKKNIPAIRFKGFDGDWRQCELEDLFSITSASRVHKNEWTKSGVPFFRSSDVVSNYKGKPNNKAFISFELYEELSKNSGCVQKNDLLVTGGGSIGIPYLVKTNEPLYFKDADLLWLKGSTDINGYFIYTFFLTLAFRSYVNSITHIGTISHYTIEQAKSTPINVPDKKEQDKIGEYLTNLDTLITLHQRKYDKLLNVKKAMLEKMFPKNREDIPEIRFKGFSEKWEEKTLGEMCTLITKGTTPLDKSGNGDINFIKVENIDKLSGEIVIATKIIKEEHENYLKRSQLKENDILFSIAGTLGRVTIVNKKILPANTNQALAIIRLKQGCLDYMTTYLKGLSVNNYIKKNPTVGAQPNLSLEQIENIELSLPKSKEQTKIGNFFKNLDTLLSLHQSQLEKLKHIKKACLEKMFV